YYWSCEFRKKYGCSGRAITDLEGEEHILISTKEHSHAPEANRVDIVKTLDIIKEVASNTYDQSARIIQDAVININQSSYSYMPNKQALRNQISRIRNKNGPSQPQSLNEIIVPIELHRTINGEEFLARDIEFGEERIMIFCAKSSSNIYKMLIGGESNACVLPMVYALMTGKSEECYNQLFQELIDLGEEVDLILNPPLILTDFEQAAITGRKVKNQAPISHQSESFHKCCFFHLYQNLWRKIQASGLAVEYGSDEDFSIKLCHLTALAFLPSSEIPDAFDQIKLLMPLNTQEVVQYFENNYICGRRRILRNGSEQRSPPLFLPNLWSVYDLIENNYPRTQNISQVEI
ncbi:hypothetical protein RhiirC2_788617, partial [Rhizophagus irregularis]